MITFWLLCAAMLALALGFVVLPLMKSRTAEVSNRENLNISIHRDHLKDLERELEEGLIEKADFDKAVEELEIELLSDMQGEEEQTSSQTGRPVIAAVLLSVTVPVISVFIYLALGEPQLIEGVPQQQVVEGATTDEMHSIVQMVERLEARLQEQPNDGEGWNMLARSYLVLKRFPEATAAYKKSRELIGDNPQLLSDLAEAMIISNNNAFTEESVDLLNQSLKADPNNKKALWMAGYFALEQSQIETVLQLWRRLLGQFPAGSTEAIALSKHITEIMQQNGITGPGATLETNAAEKAPASTAAATQTQQTATGSASIQVHVSLDPAVAANASPDDIVFIYARAAEGPRMPLAISRNRVSELPLTVTLNDSMAMSPEMSLSKFNQVVVGARVSKSGNAMPASGDINGSSGVISLTEVLGVRVTINEIIP